MVYYLQNKLVSFHISVEHLNNPLERIIPLGHLWKMPSVM